MEEKLVENGEIKIIDDENKVNYEFERLNYVNKINILLKALMIERNRNKENEIKMSVLKREYVKKAKSIQILHAEKDHLLNKAAKDEKNLEIQKETTTDLNEKLLAGQNEILKLNERISTLEEIMNKNEQSKEV